MPFFEVLFRSLSKPLGWSARYNKVQAGKTIGWEMAPASRLEEVMNAPEVLRRDDLAIREEVRRLVRDRLLLADAGLRVEGGVVGIQGRTQQRSEAEAVQRLVAQVPGVVSVWGLIEFPG